MKNKKRVALIGNMNNNNFTLLRVLRDNKIDAHLFLYTNEIFSPSSDTIDFKYWKRYIHDLGISNGKPDILFFKKSKLKDKLKEFNFFIGNGIAPYILKKINIRLNIFMPYAEGIEHINENTDPVFKSLLKGTSFSFLKDIWFKVCGFLQKISIDNCDSITTFNFHEFSINSFKKLGIKPDIIPIITFYKSDHKTITNKIEFREYLCTKYKIPQNSILLFSHVAHYWKNLPYSNYMAGIGKKNNFIIESLHEYYKQDNKKKVYLFLTEYGPDVSETKKLIKKFNIEKYIIWIEKQRRVDLFKYIESCDIGVSEFAGMLWGSCGWEFLHCNKPFFHWLDCTKEYDRQRVSLPDFFNVNKTDDVVKHLQRYRYERQKKFIEKNKIWLKEFSNTTISKIQKKINNKESKKIRIAFIIGTLNIGGTERHLLNLINNLDRRKYNIDLHLLNEKGKLFDQLDRFVRVFSPKGVIKNKLYHLINFIFTFVRIKVTNPQIIHCFLPQSYIFGGIIGFLLKHKNVIMSRRSLNLYHNNYKYLPIRQIEKFLHKKSRYILVNSKAVHKNIVDEGAPESRIKLIYNGVLKSERKLLSLENTRKKLGLSFSKKTFFSCIANLIPYKNQLLIIKAASLLKKVNDNFIVLLIGSGEKSYKKFLKAEVSKRRLTKHIVFIEQTINIEDYYLITDVGISSSKQEGFSNSILEFLNFKKPVIATNVGGNVDIINSQNGILIEDNNHDQLFAAMRKLITNKKEIVRLGRGAKKEIEKYSFAKMLRKYEQTYDEIC